MGWKLGGKEQDHELGTERGTRSRHKGTKDSPSERKRRPKNRGWGPGSPDVGRSGVGRQGTRMEWITLGKNSQIVCSLGLPDEKANENVTNQQGPSLDSLVLEQDSVLEPDQ